MAYLRAYIPACETYGWDGGPRFNTRIVTLMNGRERRNADWEQPQHAFSLPFNNLLQSAYAQIKQMQLACQGRLNCFLYRDRLDSTASNEVFAVAEAGQDTFQLAKWSTVDGVSYRRTVHALYQPDPNNPGAALPVTPVITVDGTPTVAFTVDHDTGEVVFDEGMVGGEILRWTTASFSIWVRFDNDYLPMSINNKSGDDFVISGDVNLLEMPPPEAS